MSEVRVVGVRSQYLPPKEIFLEVEGKEGLDSIEIIRINPDLITLNDEPIYITGRQFEEIIEEIIGRSIVFKDIPPEADMYAILSQGAIVRVEGAVAEVVMGPLP